MRNERRVGTHGANGDASAAIENETVLLVINVVRDVLVVGEARLRVLRNRLSLVRLDDGLSRRAWCLDRACMQS